jgi:hypothetical protein
MLLRLQLVLWSAVDNLRRIATCESKIMSHTQTVAKVAIEAMIMNTDHCLNCNFRNRLGVAHDLAFASRDAP